jgi:hypothetical protein
MMPTVVAEHVFALPVDELWAILGDFGQTGKWSGRPPEACVQEGEGIGALRTLTIQDGRVIVDRLEAQDARSYSYSVVSGLLPYKCYRATMAVEPIDAMHSRFSWTGEFEPDGITEEESIEFTENVYATGIAMMRRTIEKG